MQQDKANFDPSNNTQTSSKVIANPFSTDSYSNLGPGSYNQQPNDFENLNKKNASTRKKKIDVPTFGTGKRNTLGEVSSLSSGPGPGPGHYAKQAYAEMSEWHKKTFNYRYLKQFHTGAPGSSLGEAGLNTVFPWDNSSIGAKIQAA